MRAQTIEVRIRWETRAKAEVLGLEDKCCSGRVEEDFSRACTLYCETEGILCIVETNIAFIGRYTAPRTRKYRLWNLVNLIPFVLNLDVDAVRYTKTVSNCSMRVCKSPPSCSHLPAMAYSHPPVRLTRLIRYF